MSKNQFYAMIDNIALIEFTLAGHMLALVLSLLSGGSSAVLPPLYFNMQATYLELSEDKWKFMTLSGTIWYKMLVLFMSLFPSSPLPPPPMFNIICSYK